MKKRSYKQQHQEIKHVSFPYLVISATGGLTNEANTLYKQLASMLATKWNQSYSSILCSLCCQLSFNSKACLAGKIIWSIIILTRSSLLLTLHSSLHPVFPLPLSTAIPCWDLLHFSIQAIRGTHSSCGHRIKTATVIDLVNSESCISSASKSLPYLFFICLLMYYYINCYYCY